MEALTEFKRYLSATYSAKTTKTYLEGCKAFVRYLESAGVSPERSGQEHLEGFLVGLSESGKSPATTRTWVFGAYRLLNYLRSINRLPFDPKLPKMPRLNESRQYALNPNQFLDFMRICGGLPEPYCTALRVMACTGLRVGELVKLKANDWKVHKSFVIIQAESEKARSSRRTRFVPMLRICNRYFRDYLLGFRRAFSQKHEDNPWLFPSTRNVGEHIKISVVQDMIRRIRPRIQAKNMTPHTLRHTYSNFLSRSRVPPLVHAKIMGHKRLDTTLIYTHPTDDELGSAVEKVFIEQED